MSHTYKESQIFQLREIQGRLTEFHFANSTLSLLATLYILAFAGSALGNAGQNSNSHRLFHPKLN
jgi:hypothetical protein